MRTIIAIVDDLFFASKIKGTADLRGIPVTFPRSAEAVLEAAVRETPSLIICDLHSQKIDVIQLARQLKAAEATKGIPLLGFFSHVQIELQREAKDAGFDRVIPRSVFAKDLGQLLAGSD